MMFKTTRVGVNNYRGIQTTISSVKITGSRIEFIVAETIADRGTNSRTCWLQSQSRLFFFLSLTELMNRYK